MDLYQYFTSKGVVPYRLMRGIMSNIESDHWDENYFPVHRGKPVKKDFDEAAMLQIMSTDSDSYCSGKVREFKKRKEIKNEKILNSV